MEADHVHAFIERTLNELIMEICTPWDWQQLIRSTSATLMKLDIPDFKHVDHLYANLTLLFSIRRKILRKKIF